GRVVRKAGGLLGPPGVRVLMLEAGARDQHPRLDQRLDHGVVGVTLLALVGDDPFRLAAGVARAEAGRLVGEEAVAVDRIGDGGVDAPRLKLPRMGSPDVEVLAAVTRRGVHETRAGIVGDVFAGEQRHLEFVRWIKSSKWMRTMSDIVRIDTLYSDVAFHPHCLHDVSS